MRGSSSAAVGNNKNGSFEPRRRKSNEFGRRKKDTSIKASTEAQPTTSPLEGPTSLRLCFKRSCG